MNGIIRGHPVVGELNPHSDPLGGRYWGIFDIDIVHGLAHVTDRRIDILAVQSRFPGSGNFHRFLLALMQSYDTIAVWEILNPDLPETLARRGFRPVVEMVAGETGHGMRWDRQVKS